MLQLFHSLMGENYRGSSSANLFVHFMGGGLAGVTSASATYPLDLVRTRLAAQVISNFCSWKLLGTLFMPSVVCMNEFALFYVVVVVWLNQIHSSFNVEDWDSYFMFLCREVPFTTEASHMLSVPSVEMKVSWVCTRDLEQHCWYDHDKYFLLFFTSLCLFCYVFMTEILSLVFSY